MNVKTSVFVICVEAILYNLHDCTFKKEVHDEIFFGHIDKHQNFLQVDTIILGRHSLVCPKYANKKFAYLCNISRKTLGIKLLFLPIDKYKSFLQGDNITLAERS